MMSQPSTHPDDAELRAALTQVTTATATHLLVQRGYPNAYVSGAAPFQSGVRVCGRAVTVRFRPLRPDLAVEPAERGDAPPLRGLDAGG